MADSTYRPTLWTPGDWNAFFGFGTNILVNMLTLTALLRFVLKMPDSLVFGRILPAIGLMMCLSTMYYAFLAYRLALKRGRTDVCAPACRGVPCPEPGGRSGCGAVALQKTPFAFTPSTPHSRLTPQS